MKKLILLIGLIVLMAFTSQDHNIIPVQESPFWFYGYRDGALRLPIEYVEYGQVESLYELEHFKTYDSCFVQIYESGLTIWWEYLSLDSIEIINKADSLGIPDIRERIFW